MRMLALAKRNVKEIIRDPLNLFFGLGFPVVLLLLLTAIQKNVPVSIFEIQKITPGITVFGLSFTSLFSATLIAKDRNSSFLSRLYTTPLTSLDFILAYALPIIPVAVGQSVVCYVVAVVLGLKFNVNIVLAILFIIPISILFVAIGLLCGSVLNDKQVGGVCGALLTNLSAWLSGIWFDLDLVGGAFKKIAYMLPFVHAVELEKAVVLGDLSLAITHIWWVMGYAVILVAVAILLFMRQMNKQ